MELNNIIKIFLNTEGGASVSIETLKSGHINDTFKVDIKSGNSIDSYILQKVNHHIFTEPLKIMENIENVALHLKTKGYPKPILSCLKTLKGDYFHQNTEGYWRMIPFINNTYSILKAENDDQAYQAAKAFGEYSRYLNDINVKTVHTIIPNFHNAAFRISQFHDALKGQPSEERLKKVKPIMVYVNQNIHYFAHYTPTIPVRVTHNDTKISNILFDKTTQNASCIIDLDTLQPETILSDFGDMVRTYTPQYGEDEIEIEKIEMRLDYMKALIEGFLSEVNAFLTENEKKNLIYGAKRTIFVQALRFLTDYLNNDTYYKTSYSEHNLNRTLNQIALLKSLEAQESVIDKLISRQNSK
jgi:Ser/Thr protein kinase RdoA (MazF antagonist)